MESTARFYNKAAPLEAGIRKNFRLKKRGAGRYGTRDHHHLSSHPSSPLFSPFSVPFPSLLASFLVPLLTSLYLSFHLSFLLSFPLSFHLSFPIKDIPLSFHANNLSVIYLYLYRVSVNLILPQVRQTLHSQGTPLNTGTGDEARGTSGK